VEPRNPAAPLEKKALGIIRLCRRFLVAPGPAPTVLEMTVSDSHNLGRRSHRQNQPMGRLIHQARALRSHQR
jgi:hypothetical protein